MAEISTETVSLESLIEKYGMSLSDVAEKVDADADFIREATQYLLEFPEELTHQSEKDEFIADRLNRFMTAGLDIKVIADSIIGKPVQELLSERGMTLRMVAEQIGLTDEDAIDKFIAETTRELLTKPKDDTSQKAEKYAFDTFFKYALSGLDLNVAADMTDLRKSDLVKLSNMTERMRQRDLKIISDGVKQGLSFPEICMLGGWPYDASLAEIARLQGYPLQEFKAAASQIILLQGTKQNDNDVTLATERFEQYVGVGLDIPTVCEAVRLESYQEKADFLAPYLKDIVAADILTLDALSKQMNMSLAERKMFSQRATRVLLDVTPEERNIFHGDTEAAVLENLHRFAFAGLNPDIAAHCTKRRKADIQKEILKPARLHKKTLVNFAHTALTEASYGNISTKASRFFASRSADFYTKAAAADKKSKQKVYETAGMTMKKLSLAGKGIDRVEKTLKKPFVFVDEAIDKQIMKVGERNETAGRVLSTAKSVVNNSAEAFVVGAVATAVAPTLSVSAASALTAVWGVTYFRSAKKGLYAFYDKAAKSYRKDPTKTPAQNRAGVRRSVGKYVEKNNADLRKAWINAGMNVTYGMIGSAALIKVSPTATLYTQAGYKSVKNVVKYSRRGVKASYMMKNDIKDLNKIRGQHRRMKFTAQKVLTGVTLVAVGENADKFGFSNVDMGQGFKSGDFFYIPVMDSTYITSKNDFHKKLLKELRSCDGDKTTGLTLDQIARAHGYDNVQMSQFTKEMTKTLLSEGKTEAEKQALFEKHAMDGIDLYQAFVEMKVEKPAERKKLIADNISDLAYAGITLNEMSEAIGLKSKKRHAFEAEMTDKLLSVPDNVPDKKQAFFDNVRRYGAIGLDKNVLLQKAASVGVMQPLALEACLEAKVFYRKQKKQEIEQGRQVLEQNKKEEKQAKKATLEETKDFLKNNSSADLFATMRQKRQGRS